MAPGDDSGLTWSPNTTYWFQPGTHTLGTSQFGQIVAPAGSTFIGAPGAIINGEGINNYAFTQTAVGVTIEYLTIENFIAPTNEGVVNHDSGAKWIIRRNTIIDNGGAAVMVGPSDLVVANCLADNGQYGFNAYLGTGVNTNVTIVDNEITGNDSSQTDISDSSCGCFGGGKLWNTVGAIVSDNWVHNNYGPGIWVDTDNAGVSIENNYIAGNDDQAIIYELSYNGHITNNTIVDNAWVEGQSFAQESSTFPVSAIYISESGGDSRVDGGLYATFDIANNNLVDNWGGVTLWENADRFCGSPANTSSTFCTMVDPSVANLTTCNASNISSEPYYSDCRWKTQNVSVYDNTFALTKANVPGCASATSCGEQGLLSNFGTYPSWSPYMGSTIENAITYDQNNHFAHNAYTGDWLFAPYAANGAASFALWQAPPNSQDVDSPSANAGTTANIIDPSSAGLEGSIGSWVPSTSTTVADSTVRHHSGTSSLEVTVTAPGGWSAQISNSPGFPASPGPYTASFWAAVGQGSFGATMAMQWLDGNGNTLEVDPVTIPALNSSWQQGTANLTAPAGTVAVQVTLEGTPGAGVSGDYLFADDFYLASRPNVIDTKTATMEGSLGNWVTWYSATPSRSTAAAHAGSASMLVNITAPWGWGIQLGNQPGYPITPGSKVISFWALEGSQSLGAHMEVDWMDSSGSVVLQTNTIAIPALTTSWQQMSATVTAPPGTATARIEFAGTTGTVGDYLYIDDVYVSL